MAPVSQARSSISAKLLSEAVSDIVDVGLFKMELRGLGLGCEVELEVEQKEPAVKRDKMKEEKGWQFR